MHFGVGNCCIFLSAFSRSSLLDWCQPPALGAVGMHKADLEVLLPPKCAPPGLDHPTACGIQHALDPELGRSGHLPSRWSGAAREAESSTAPLRSLATPVLRTAAWREAPHAPGTALAVLGRDVAAASASAGATVQPPGTTTTACRARVSSMPPNPRKAPLLM